jgi:hypothetical protein
MGEFNQSIPKKVYAMIKAGESPTKAFLKVAQTEQLSAGHVKIAAMAINQMMRASAKTAGEHSRRFEIIDPDSILSSLKKTQKPAFAKKGKSDLSHYRRTPSSNYMLMVDGLSKEAFDNPLSKVSALYDWLEKLASTETHLVDQLRGRRKENDTAQETLFQEMRTAIQKNASLEKMGAAFVAVSTKKAATAQTLCRYIAKTAADQGYLPSESLGNLWGLSFNNLARHFEVTPPKLASNSVTDSYQSFLVANGRLEETEESLKNVRHSIIKTAEAINSCFLFAANECPELQKTASFGKAIGSSFGAGMGTAGALTLARMLSKEPSFSKRVSEALPNALAIAGISSVPAAMIHSYGHQKHKGQKSKSYKRMLEAFPEIEDGEETLEMFDMITDANSQYADKPLQVGKLIQSIQDQGQFMTPDMVMSLNKGAPSGGKGIGDQIKAPELKMKEHDPDKTSISAGIHKGMETFQQQMSKEDSKRL